MCTTHTKNPDSGLALKHNNTAFSLVTSLEKRVRACITSFSVFKTGYSVAAFFRANIHTLSWELFGPSKQAKYLRAFFTHTKSEHINYSERRTYLLYHTLSDAQARCITLGILVARLTPTFRVSARPLCLPTRFLYLLNMGKSSISILPKYARWYEPLICNTKDTKERSLL